MEDNKKILYVIGAGASSEVNLPVGSALKDKIANYLYIKRENGSRLDPDIAEALSMYARDTEEDFKLYIDVCTQISGAMPLSLSIDNYIHAHKDNKKIELCGKLAIVRSILEAERDSLLFVDNSDDYQNLEFNSLDSTWYMSFVKLLTEDCTKDVLSERLKSISLIIFNYDRCVEHFLYHAFQTYYSMSAEEAANFVNEIEIYHPYGVVGNLPWQESLTSVSYGEELFPSKLLDIVKQIKTFTEGVDPTSSDITAIRRNVHNADNIVFLGFAFHALNMELISPNKLEFNYKETSTNYFGSALGLSGSDIKIIESELKGFTNRHINKISLEYLTKCSELFENNWRTFSFT